MKALSEPIAAYGEMVNTTRFKERDGVRPFSSNSTWQEDQNIISGKISDLLDRLRKLEALEDNWDSYGAKKPTTNALKSANKFLRKYHSTGLPFYFIAPGVDGEVMIEFSRGNKAAELYFNEDGSNELLLFVNDDVKTEGTLESNFEEMLQFFEI